MIELERVDWNVLNNYNVKPGDLEDEQSFQLNAIAALSSSKFNYGIMSGAVVSLSAGLGIAVSEGVIYFENDLFAKLEVHALDHDAADISFDRYDRIEAYYEEDDGRAGFSEGGTELVVTKHVRAKVEIKKGAAAASPVIPAATTGRVTLGVVKVRTGEVTLQAADLFLDERYRKESTIKVEQLDIVVGNDTTKELPVLVDDTLYKSILITYDAFRATDDGSKTQLGEIVLIYNPKTAAWQLSNPYRGDACGVTFSVAPSKFLQVTTDDLAGANYEDKISIVDIKRVKR